MIFTADLIKKDKSETEKESLKEEEFIPGLTPFTRKRKANANTGSQLLRKKAVKEKITGKDIKKDVGKGIKEKAVAGEGIIKMNIIKTGIARKGIVGKGNKKRKNDNDGEDFKPAASRRRKR
jgi:hypothetical protein